MMTQNIIEEYYHSLVAALQYFGWYIVAFVLLLYFSQPYLKKMWHDYSLRQANDPYRKAILDEERKKVRLAQQRKLAWKEWV